MDILNINRSEIVEQTGIALVKEGTPGDALLGIVPTAVAHVKSIEEISRLLSWANERGLKVASCGARTKLDRGAPPARCDILLDLSNLSGVVEHAAGDLTVTARAGTRLSDLQHRLAEAGQFLAVDPPVAGTVGGLIATGDSGPRRLRYGGVRDLLLGVTIVRADGVIAKGGGKVVKNVAGYDLPKLFTGSLGTLGVIVEATFRLYPLPAASATVVIEQISIRQASRLITTIVESALTPTILDYFAAPNTAESIFAARFESSPLSVQTQAAHAGAQWSEAKSRAPLQSANPEPLILAGEDEASLWQSFSNIASTKDNDILARLISTRSDLPTLLEIAQTASEQAGTNLSLRAHMGHGHALLRWHEPSTETAISLLTPLRREAEARASNVVVWRAPAEVHEQLDVWGDVGEGLGLMRKIKAQFDPLNTLNPGRFVGGI